MFGMDSSVEPATLFIDFVSLLINRWRASWLLIDLATRRWFVRA